MSYEPAYIANQIVHEPDVFKKAALIAELRRDKEMQVREIAELLDMKDSYVSHYLRLLKLPNIVVDGYYGKFVSKSHLFIIARLPDQPLMKDVYEEVLAKGLTAFQTEELVRRHLYGITSEGSYLPHTEAAEFDRHMRQKNNKIRTKLIQSRTRAKLIMEVEGNLFFTSEIMRNIMKTLMEQSPSLYSKARAKKSKDNA
jgi:ParB-like chromosome segregation protein Spo0J